MPCCMEQCTSSMHSCSKHCRQASLCVSSEPIPSFTQLSRCASLHRSGEGHTKQPPAACLRHDIMGIDAQPHTEAPLGHVHPETFHVADPEEHTSTSYHSPAHNCRKCCHAQHGSAQTTNSNPQSTSLQTAQRGWKRVAAQLRHCAVHIAAVRTRSATSAVQQQLHASLVSPSGTARPNNVTVPASCVVSEPESAFCLAHA
jgi:hypothetical protein